MSASTSGTLRFALIGCGRIGRRHAEIIHSKFELVAVCDADVLKAEQFANEFGATPHNCFTDFINAGVLCDIVVVATPNSLHSIQTISLLKAGYHVICEKPMALTAAAALQMIEAAQRYERKLWVVKQNRFNPPVQLIKELLTERERTSVAQVSMQCFWNRDSAYYRNSWRGTLKYDGGILYTQFSHFIDVAIWLCGPLSNGHLLVSSGLKEKPIEFEDCGAISAKFESGALFSMAYSVNSQGKNMEGSFSLLTRNGSYKIGGEYLNTLEYHHPEIPGTAELKAGRYANQYGSYTGSMSNHPEFYTKVVSSFNGVAAPEVDDTMSGYLTVAFIENIYRSVGREPTDLQNPNEAP